LADAVIGLMDALESDREAEESVPEIDADFEQWEQPASLYRAA
jgi:hypothetical protein